MNAVNSENYYDEPRMVVKKYYSQYDLATLKVVKEWGGWSNTPEHVRKEVLWELGINTKRKPAYREEFCRHRRINSKEEVAGIQVYGEERLDAEWIDKRVDGYRVASLEAQLAAKGDKSLAKEMRRIANGRGL